jgi:hypothetical protein
MAAPTPGRDGPVLLYADRRAVGLHRPIDLVIEYRRVRHSDVSSGWSSIAATSVAARA